MKIADLHCDLLSYLAAHQKRTIYDPESRCSLPQLKKGGICFQTLAIFSETNRDPVAFGKEQLQCYLKLKELKRIHEGLFPLDSEQIHCIAAIENASSLCAEEEPLDLCFERLQNYISAPLLYISLTWHRENRFGGGNLSSAGLKRDGELLLEYLSGKQIAIDFSHTSDALASDILSYMSKKGLKIYPLASHSNFRKIQEHARNLRDDVAKEICARGGVIGLNLIKDFVGDPLPEKFLEQVEYGKRLVGSEALAFGADFFYAEKENSIPEMQNRAYFHPEFENASCYPKLLHALQKILKPNEIENISHRNFANFLKRLKTACD
jgi:membrane dipeptidase